MLCKIAVRTRAGWFFWDDMLFSTEDRARAYIDKSLCTYKEDLFLVYPAGRGEWGTR